MGDDVTEAAGAGDEVAALRGTVAALQERLEESQAAAAAQQLRILQLEQACAAGRIPKAQPAAGGYCPRSFEVTLTPAQREVLRQVQAGLGVANGGRVPALEETIGRILETIG